MNSCRNNRWPGLGRRQLIALAGGVGLGAALAMGAPSPALAQDAEPVVIGVMGPIYDSLSKLGV